MIQILQKKDPKIHLSLIYDANWDQYQDTLSSEIQSLGTSDYSEFFQKLSQSQVELVMIGSIANWIVLEAETKIQERLNLEKFFCVNPK